MGSGVPAGAAEEARTGLYKEYKMLKQQRVESEPSQPGPSGQAAAQEPPATEQVPDSGCWGSHLNRQPTAPRLSRRVPERSVQYYGMKLKAKLGAPGKETPLTPRRPSAPRKPPLVPAIPKEVESSGGTAAAAPTEPSPGGEDEAEDVLLPPSVSGLTPIIRAAGSKPSPAPRSGNRFRELKETVAQRLGSLDPAWLRRCQGTAVDEGAELGAARGEERGEGVCAPLEQE
ncbi:ATP-dependent DNA helicase Q4-like, partial [Guaruba guarouba]